MEALLGVVGQLEGELRAIRPPSEQLQTQHPHQHSNQARTGARHLQCWFRVPTHRAGEKHNTIGHFDTLIPKPVKAKQEAPVQTRIYRPHRPDAISGEDNLGERNKVYKCATLLTYVFTRY